MKGATAVATILRSEGVDYLFCSPINPAIDAAAEVGIKPILTRTSAGFVGMADGYSRITNGRRIGVCAAQWGPGIEDAFGGVAQAYSDSTPILVLPSELRQSRTETEPATFDAARSFQRVTKWAARVNMAERIPEFMRRAFTYLRTGGPGPVLLALPMDVLAAEAGDAAAEYRPIAGARPMASPADVAAAVKAILSARNPLIQAGVGILYAEAWEELREFADLVQAPVSTTLQGKSAFPEDHPLFVGSGSRAGSRALARYLAESDLIFGAGSGLAISNQEAPIPGGKVAVQLAIAERDFNRDYAVHHLLLGDAKLVLQQMIEEARRQLGPEGRKGDDRVARQIRAINDAWLGEWMPKLTSSEVPLNPYRVVWDVQQALDLRNVIATHDCGNPRDQVAPFWPALEPNSYLGWGKSTHLGYGLPLAMGAKVARPEKTVLNFTGDYAFGITGIEIETAARNRIGTLTIVLNNGTLGGYEKHLPVSTRLYRTRFISGDYTRMAEALGAHTERVEEPGEIIPAVRRALEHTDQGRPALLEMMVVEENQLSRYW